VKAVRARPLPMTETFLFAAKGFHQRILFGYNQMLERY
jgi:hypothetical protein